MRILSIDLETCSSRDLARCGVYAYCDSEDFEILLFAYAFDDEEAFCLTGIHNPNSTSQIKDWLREKGLEVKSLAKKSVEKLADTAEDPEAWGMMELRNAMSKTSVKKYEAMERYMRQLRARCSRSPWRR